MHPRVDRLPAPAPDYRRFLAAVRRQRPDRIPLIELAVHPTVVSALLDESPATSDDPNAGIRRSVRLHHRLGYDVVKVSAAIPFAVPRVFAEQGGARAWANEQHGPIATLADCERFPWPAPQNVDFSPVDAAHAVLPDGMALIGFSGGVLEFAMDLLGMERFMLATRRDPPLVAAVIERVGTTIYAVFESYCQIDAVQAIWLGDDLGYKTGTLLAPRWLSTHIVPWYRRFAELAHAHGRPFLLHTCGNTAAVMSDLVAAGIDAKHSFEDVIQPVEQFTDAWGDQVAVLGGVDVHLLTVGDEAAIRARTLQILEHATLRGGYVCGSGNSIPDYVPPEHYLAMIEAVVDFNGR